MGRSRWIRPLLALAVIALVATAGITNLAGAASTLLASGSLREGDYGDGDLINTFGPNHGGSPGVPGIADGPDGATFTPTEANGQSNALINFVIGNPPGFRDQGSMSLMFRADRADHVNGSLITDNYGYDQFFNGLSTFAVWALRRANGAGDADDQIELRWDTWHSNVWDRLKPKPVLEYDRWYSIGFNWGTESNDFEMCVDGVQVAVYDLPAPFSLPWGHASPPSATNLGLGDNHARGHLGYSSPSGVTVADVAIWDMPQPFCGTVGGTLVAPIDIHPGDVNEINPSSNGVTPVAILTTDSFDATEVDGTTVRFGPNEAAEAHTRKPFGHFEDVDLDGDIDLVFHFETQATGIDCGDTSATLTGELLDGTPFEGEDVVITTGC